MENHHFQWVNPLFLWQFSIAKTVSLPEGNLTVKMGDVAIFRPNWEWWWSSDDPSEMLGFDTKMA
jgi:hypothetical protein